MAYICKHNFVLVEKLDKLKIYACKYCDKEEYEKIILRTFEEQRREFVELALKLKVKSKLKYIPYGSLEDRNVFILNNKDKEENGKLFEIKEDRTIEQNETEIQKLRDLVEELG